MNGNQRRSTLKKSGTTLPTELWFRFKLRGHRKLANLRKTVDSYIAEYEITAEDVREDIPDWMEETKTFFDEIDFELRQSLLAFNQSQKEMTFDLYYRFREDLRHKRNVLKYDLRESKRRLDHWNQVLSEREEDSQKKIIDHKVRYWCHYCWRSAAQTFQCCFRAEYCSYVHFKADKTHFLECGHK